MKERKGKCTNFGNCTLADTRQMVTVRAGRDLLCPDCGRALIESGGLKPVGRVSAPAQESLRGNLGEEINL
jgi:hypothetical protein